MQILASILFSNMGNLLDTSDLNSVPRYFIRTIKAIYTMIRKAGFQFSKFEVFGNLFFPKMADFLNQLQTDGIYFQHPELYDSLKTLYIMKCKAGFRFFTF